MESPQLLQQLEAWRGNLAQLIDIAADAQDKARIATQVFAGLVQQELGASTKERLREIAQITHSAADGFRDSMARVVQANNKVAETITHVRSR